MKFPLGVKLVTYSMKKLNWLLDCRPYLSLGFATEASRAVNNIPKTIGHKKLIASHFNNNPASGKVLGKLDFQNTGMITQHKSKAAAKMLPVHV
jgi:RimJ/RimL family protein N-acetyltransferase